MSEKDRSLPTPHTGVPIVSREILNYLLTPAGRPNLRTSWHEIEKDNPHLAELITIISNELAPHDPAERARHSAVAIYITTALQRAATLQHLDELLTDATWGNEQSLDTLLPPASDSDTDTPS